MNIFSKIHPIDLALKTKDSSLIKNFEQAKMLADSMVVTIFNTDSVLSQFNIRYGFDYDYWVKSNKDSLFVKPKKYEFLYNLRIDNDTIFSSASIEIDTLHQILNCDFPSFVGLKKLYYRELKINQLKAKKIAINNGVSSNGLTVLFKHKKNGSRNMQDPDSIYNFNKFKIYWVNMQSMKYKFYWHVKNNCNGCVWLMIDSENGEIFDKGRVRYIY